MIDFWRTSYGSNDIDNANLLNKIFYSIFTPNSDSIDGDSLTSDVLSPLTDIKLPTMKFTTAKCSQNFYGF